MIHAAPPRLILGRAGAALAAVVVRPPSRLPSFGRAVLRPAPPELPLWEDGGL